MADKVRYPQIPATVWWGVRAILRKSPSATIDERYLSVELGVQDAASKAYLNELKSVGLLSEDNKATQLAQSWRLDDSYAEAVDEFVRRNYPDGLLQIASQNNGERQKIISWFMKEGLGQGAAGNKTATFLLISSEIPGDSVVSSNGSSKKSEPVAKREGSNGVTRLDRDDTGASRAKIDTGKKELKSGKSRQEFMPLNINLQIHISAEAGSEQIEAIFSAMKRYLNDT